MFDWLPFPALLASRAGTFLQANEGGRCLLDAGDPLVVVDGHLELASAAGRHTLALTVARMASDGDGGSAIALPRQGCDFPLLLSLRPVPAATARCNGVAVPNGIAPAQRLVLFLALNDGGAADRIAGERPLTGTETAILRALLAGETARQIACRRNVSISTVRGQVRQILAKHGLESLNQLILWARAWQ